MPAFLLACATACASQGPVPELPRQLPETIPVGFEQSVEARIEASLPEVSYSVTSPQFPDLVYETTVDGEKTLDHDRIEGWIRELESLDGNRPVVCRTVSGNVFGQCTFPVSNVPAEDPPNDEMKD